MNYIQRQYHAIRLFYKQNIRNILPITILIFILSIVLCSIIISANPGLATRLLIRTDTFVDAQTNIAGLLPTIFENLFTGCYLIVLGVIPFLFIPLLFVILNGGIIGVLLGSTSISNVTYGLLLANILPHGILLIPAMLFASAYGIYVCKIMVLHMLHKQPIGSIKMLLIELGRVYGFVILPLMIIGSVLQVLITPLIVSFL